MANASFFPSSSSSSARRCVLLLLLVIDNAHACTNLLITPGASSENKAMIAYNADDGTMEGMVYHYPATSGNSPSKRRSTYSWDTGVRLGQIREAPSTFNVVGNANSEGLVIAETTFGGIEKLSRQTGAVLDYGSLIYVTLQRASTAREAIKTMEKLMDEYGYASGGESFSLADSTTGEVWVMEVIGRGNGNKGAAWVAMRIPDGAVSAHANQARITTFPRDDPDNCLYSKDVVDLAVTHGLYERTADDPHDLNFSFSDTYDPVTYDGARFCEARVWAMFSRIEKLRTGTDDFSNKYVDYVTGKNFKNRMPLYVTVVETAETRTNLLSTRNHHHHLHYRDRLGRQSEDRTLSLFDVDDLMSDHYENSVLSPDKDVAAGIMESPYRPRPVMFQYDSAMYGNGERMLATQQTGWNFIAEITVDGKSGKNENHPCAALLWFGLDDSSTAPRAPVYGCSTNVSEHWSGKGTQDGVPSAVFAFDTEKAFWVQNMVSNLVYANWKTAWPVLKEKRRTTLEGHVKQVKALETQGLTVERATEFTVKAGDELHKSWWALYGELFARFRDYYDFSKDKSNESCGCYLGFAPLDTIWKKRIVIDKGNFCKDTHHVSRDASMMSDEEYYDPLKPISKLDLKAFQ